MAAVFKDVGEIYSRLFDHRPFLSGEIKFFLKELEEKRNEREVERLFRVLERVTELREGQLERLTALGDAHLPPLSTCLQVASSMATRISQADAQVDSEAILGERRQARSSEWERFLQESSEKSVRVDNAFKDKELQLRGYYLRLEEQMNK